MSSSITTRTMQADGSYIDVTVDARTSIEVSHNASGQITYSVKVYFTEHEDGVLLVKALTDRLDHEYEGRLAERKGVK